MDHINIKTLGELKASNYTSISVKDELRKNLIRQLQDKDAGFDGILGYDETVIPELQTAILSRHNILLLGLRGQAKTRIARLMVNLLDEYIPYISGSEIFDDPLNPISWYAKHEILIHGDNTPISWQHRSERYTEKLATPDVTVADLIGDVDPIKAATLKLTYNDERVIHFGLIPRAHRSIFVINELPDLQARIQVALFNMLQEKDIQIRGFKLRLPLDVQFVFTANPEDYTNRGSIVTPLKDRIESQILTHYPKTIAISRKITFQEARISPEQNKNIEADGLVKDLVEQVAFEARKSEFIDQKSGVSARLTISAYENLISTAERRMLINREKNTMVRLSDLTGIIPAVTGKIELVYEGELEGPAKVANTLIGKAIKSLFARYFPDPEKAKKSRTANPYAAITEWFTEGHTLDISDDLSNAQYKKELMKVAGLYDLVKKLHPKVSDNQTLLLMEFALHGLAEYSQLNKKYLEGGFGFSDMFDSLFNVDLEEEDEDDNY
ncbi:sigma 54-interacting transcriptional regulator [Pedobacter heparinus]|uniref:Mg-chelatase subunit ChlI n=1 Tax=Pedobacter heparinus (strain ATCC 13125 / DSM 2366 / CIP 104194 / JCM 7457 / NBRC 12017 / NCIMB 9290 / NRRL B-14731 / HIM 762-3) TaxID=485917 RepID=C6XZP9_PEDHD|nr:sigma 54-interacting transcriptional regulator [Pedobacter heparinus]ACU02594.1 Mg-chelatase subunit ChlI [Pedobacter heparinus DSM 2366]